MAHQPPPPRPSGSSEAALFMQRVWDMLWDPNVSHFVDTPDVKFAKGRNGTYTPTIKVRRGGSTTGSSDPVWLP